MRIFKKAIPFGEPILLENIGTEIDPALDSVLLKQTFKQAGVISIKLGDGIIDYSKDFALFITTKLRSPHFLPELSTKVTVIDFALTYDGLKDQLLDLVIQKEKQELDEKRSRLIKQNYEYKRELKKREDNILEVLRTTQGNILENESAVNAVKESQEAAAQVKEKQQIALETEASLEVVRAEYIPIAKHVAELYFIVSNLGKINEMFQYSLSWYLMLLDRLLILQRNQITWNNDWNLSRNSSRNFSSKML
jgi:dynein heavy chain